MNGCFFVELTKNHFYDILNIIENIGKKRDKLWHI